MKLKADVFLDEKLIYYLHMIVHMFNVLCAIWMLYGNINSENEMNQFEYKQNKRVLFPTQNQSSELQKTNLPFVTHCYD